MADTKLNARLIRLWQIEQTMVHIRNNAAALGYGANMAGESLRAERDEIVADVREAGAYLVEEAIDQAQRERDEKKAAAD